MKTTLSFLIPIAIFFFVGEIAVRSLDFFSKEPPYDTAELDAKLGWKAKGNYSFKGEMRDAAGEYYEVNLSTQANGFRAYPVQPDTSLSQILFLGDSYTQAVEVSDDKIFYEHINQQLPVQVYAYGMAGTGTLQEWMFLKRYLNKIQPDLVVLQFCANDFIDNYADLELESAYKVGLRRPYFDIATEKISYQVPIKGWRKYVHTSKFIRFVLEKFPTTPIEETEIAEYKIAHQQLDYAPFAASVEVTEHLLQLIQKELPSSTPLALFSADYYEPQYSILKNMCARNGILFLDQAIKNLNAAKTAQEVIYSRDGYHWNERGHELVGTGLSEDLKKIKE